MSSEDKYSLAFVPRVRDLCFLGATTAEIAKLFGVSVTTLLHWKNAYPEFAAAWNDGMMHADAKVAGALFKKACGFTYEVWKDTPGGGKLHEQKYSPPDTAACIFWLTNRRSDNWQNKVDHTNTLKGELDHAAVSDLETARRIAYALALGLQQANENQQKVIEHHGHEERNSPKT